jgi:imidazolonepropionase-like amidohydrolase
MQAWIPLLVFLFAGIQEGLAQTSADPAKGDDSTTVAFVNVGVVSMQNEVLLRGQTVVVHGELIQSIAAVDALPVPEGATVIDGSGRYLIPGLADMHVHVDVPFAEGPVFLDAGITTVLSLGTRSPDTGATLRERDLSRSPEFMGPALYTVGPLILRGSSPGEAERIVRENVELGFDMVKVYGTVSPEAFDRLHETARQLGIKVTGHAQRNRGMQPIYTHRQDIAHVEEYLYAALNPATPGFWRATAGSLVVLILFSLTAVGWDLSALWRWSRKHRSHHSPASSSLVVRRWVRIFTCMSWLLTVGLALILPEPFIGVYAGRTVGVTIVGALMLGVPAVALLLTMRARSAWRGEAATFWKRVFLLILVGAAWIHVACSAFLTSRSWRSTEAGMESIAQASAEADIWVTPTLVVLDYNRRQNTDEFYALIERPRMRYLTPGTRNRWINNNEYRVPEPMRQVQFAIWQNWTGLMIQLTRKLNEANVPLLAGSDAVGPHGVLPGSSLHEELSLLVQSGLTPYEALRTATVNPAAYLDAEHEFGKIAEGYRADLVLLTGNPLEDIHHTGTRVGVMKRGRWFPASEMEKALEQLAEERK